MSLYRYAEPKLDPRSGKVNDQAAFEETRKHLRTKTAKDRKYITCRSCKRSRVTAHFHKDKNLKSGYRTICRDCRSQERKVKRLKASLANIEKALTSFANEGNYSCRRCDRVELSSYNMKTRHNSVLGFDDTLCAHCG